MTQKRLPAIEKLPVPGRTLQGHQKRTEETHAFEEKHVEKKYLLRSHAP